MGIHDRITRDRAGMNSCRMAAAVGVIDLPGISIDMLLKHEYVVAPNCHHSRSWSRSRKPEPVGSKPQGSNGRAKDANGSAAAAKLACWTSGRVANNGCRLLDFRDSLNGLPSFPVHPDLNGANPTQEVRLVGTWPHHVAGRKTGRNRLGFCPK